MSLRALVEAVGELPVSVLAEGRTCWAVEHYSRKVPAYCEGRAAYRCVIIVPGGSKDGLVCGACARAAEDDGALLRALRL